MSDCSSAHVRASILNPGLDVSPLKFPSWIREQARDVDLRAMSGQGDHHHSLLVLFLPKRTYNVLSAAKVNKILQDITERFHSIARIELRLVDQALTMEQLAQEQQNIEAHLNGLAEEFSEKHEH